MEPHSVKGTIINVSEQKVNEIRNADTAHEIDPSVGPALERDPIPMAKQTMECIKSKKLQGKKNRRMRLVLNQGIIQQAGEAGANRQHISPQWEGTYVL